MIRHDEDGRLERFMEQLPSPLELLHAVAVTCLIWAFLIGLWLVAVP